MSFSPLVSDTRTSSFKTNTVRLHSALDQSMAEYIGVGAAVFKHKLAYLASIFGTTLKYVKLL